MPGNMVLKRAALSGLNLKLVKRCVSLVVLLVLSLMCSNPSVALYAALQAPAGEQIAAESPAPLTSSNLLDAASRAAAIPLIPGYVINPLVRHSAANPALIVGNHWWNVRAEAGHRPRQASIKSADVQPASASLDSAQLETELLSMAAGGPEQLARYNSRWEPGYRSAFMSRASRTAGIDLIPPKPPAALTMQTGDVETRARLESISQEVDALIAPLKGDYAVYFQALDGDARFGLNAQQRLTAASLIKMPVLVALYREADAGRINLDTIYTLQTKDLYDGSGVLLNEVPGKQYTYRELASLMGEFSDNTAFHYIADQVLGADLVQATISFIGMPQTDFNGRLTTAEDIGQLFAKLYLEPVVSDAARQEILGFITSTAYEDRIPAGIPAGIVVSHKIGSEPGIVSDAGIVFASRPFVLVIMTEHASVRQAQQALPQIANIIYSAWEN